MSNFGGFQTGAFQTDFQTTLIVIDPGPSIISFLPASSKAQVPELTDYYATIEYVDIYGNGFVPDTVQWRVWDATNLVQLQDWTIIATPTEQDQIHIPGACNALGNAKNLVETREVIFNITASGGAVRYDIGVYYVLAVPDIL